MVRAFHRWTQWLLDTDSVFVTVEPNVVIPTGFTPNSDGRNDIVIDYIELFPECVVEVYNRWGDQLFRRPDTNKQPWDGKYRDGYVPVGTYYYVTPTPRTNDS